jgi:hypothetical protein
MIEIEVASFLVMTCTIKISIDFYSVKHIRAYFIINITECATMYLHKTLALIINQTSIFNLGTLIIDTDSSLYDISNRTVRTTQW